MATHTQHKRAQLFAQKWQQKAGYAKYQTQAFWRELLRDVLDMPEASELIKCLARSLKKDQASRWLRALFFCPIYALHRDLQL